MEMFGHSLLAFDLLMDFTFQSIKPLPWKARVPEKHFALVLTANQATMLTSK